MDALIRRYYEGCNHASRRTMLETLHMDAVHYFPAGAPQGPFVGAEAIADGWIAAVGRLDSRWTIDRLIFDEDAQEAVLEWTHFKPAVGAYLRGDEWFRFQDGLIGEIRAYYACPPTSSAASYEIGEFPYAARGYAMTAPDVKRQPG